MKSRIMGRMAYATRIGEMRRASRVLVGEPEEKRPLGRPKRRWENNIKIYLLISVTVIHGLD
jgi:hypothetical protein